VAGSFLAFVGIATSRLRRTGHHECSRTGYSEAAEAHGGDETREAAHRHWRDLIRSSNSRARSARPAPPGKSIRKRVPMRLLDVPGRLRHTHCLVPYTSSWTAAREENSA
jgi:hypothetical protein